MMFCYCLTQRSINYKATLADGMRVALLIHDSLHDIMFLASLQRIVRCTSSKEERLGATTADWYFMYCCPTTSSCCLWSSVCCAWSTIHSRTVKPFTASLVSGTMSYRSFSLGTTVLCPWCWLTENIQQAALCLWPGFVFFVGGGVRFSFAPSLYRLRYSRFKSETASARQQWKAIFRQTLRTTLET